MNNEIVRLPESSSRNYRARIATLFEKLERDGKIKPGAITDAWFLHDRWCAVWHGHPCNCNPAIEIRTAG